jgi:cobalamin biosynthesis protein CobD/CbiB
MSTSPPPEKDWAAQAADTLEGIVQTIRDRATGPALTVVRAVVYGALAAFAGIVGVVLLAILVVRVLDVAIPGDVWIPHLIVGTIFTLAGLLLFAKRRPRPEAS